MTNDAIGMWVLWVVCLFTSITGVIVINADRESTQRVAAAEVRSQEWNRMKNIMVEAKKGDLVVYQNELLVFLYADTYDTTINYNFSVAAVSREGNLVNGMKTYTQRNGVIVKSPKEYSIGWTATLCHECHNINVEE